MATRAMNPLAGFDWLMRGINLGRNNPKAIFGGTALLLLALFGAVLVMSLLTGILMALMGESISGMIVVAVVMMLATLAVMAPLLVGYFRLIHAIESNRPARATDVFGGFGDKSAALRAIGFFLLLMIVQNVLILGTIGVLAADVIGWYFNLVLTQAQTAAPGADSLASAIPPNLPEGLGLAMLVMLVVGLVSMGVQAIGLGQIALRGAGVGGAFGDGVTGAFKNLLPLLVQMIAVIVAAAVAAILVGIVMLVVGLLAKAVGTWLLVVLGIPLYIGFYLAMIAVIFGMQYHCWRDVCDGGDDSAAVPADALTA